MAEHVKVAQLAELEPGTTKVVDVQGRRIALCHVRDGGVFAVDDVCTHDGAPLDQGDLDGHAIECPRHGARFDVRTGAVIALPAMVPIQTYDVHVDGDDVSVRVS